MKRLYLVTGKGGVGKTIYALSHALKLKNSGHHVLFSSLDSIPQETCEALQLPYRSLDLMTSTQAYIERKLKSKLVASWLVKTPFFKAILQMIPGLNYVIFLGDLLDQLQKNPDLTIVLDSPASGHALTLFEACRNFQEIFQSGLIFNDINKMLQFFHAPHTVDVAIVTIPSRLAMSEALELQEKLMTLGPYKPQIIVNKSYKSLKNSENSNVTWPEFLEEKIKIENEVIKNHQSKISQILPYAPKVSTSEIVTFLQKYLEKDKGISP